MVKSIFSRIQIHLNSKRFGTANLISKRGSGMFAHSNINPNVTLWNTRNVLEMEWMFGQNPTATPDTSLWNISSCVKFEDMFKDAEAANKKVPMEERRFGALCAPGLTRPCNPLTCESGRACVPCSSTSVSQRGETCEECIHGFADKATQQCYPCGT